MKKHRYCIYARVSPKGSQWSAQETTIRAQIAECREYILTGDPRAEFIEVYDEFKSGKDLNRPGIQGILEDIESGRPSFDTLVVWQLDRLSRNLADAAPLFEKLRDADLGFISIRQSYLSATGAMARFNLTQTIAIAQLEREMTSERITAKMHWIASQGKVTWGKLPLGYRRVKGKKNIVEIDEAGAEIVREIFRLYYAGHQRGTFEDLHNFWNAHKEVLGDFKRIYKTLRNRLYIAEIAYKDEIFKAEHPPIIDKQLFEEIQKLLPGEKHNTARPGRRKYAYLLSGLVRCCCNPERYMRPASVKKKNSRYFYYQCTSTDCQCLINAEKLDTAVLEAITGIALDPQYIKECYGQHMEQVAAQQQKERKNIAAAMAECEEAAADLKKIDEMFMSGIVTKENAAYWNEKLFEARNRKELAEQKYKEQVSELDTLNEKEQLAAILESVTNWADLLKRSPDDNVLKRKLIMSLVRQVRCIEKGEFEVDLVFATPKNKKIGISPCGVMPKGDDWWSSRYLNITVAISIAIGCSFR